MMMMVTSDDNDFECLYLNNVIASICFHGFKHGLRKKSLLVEHFHFHFHFG